jgi:aryl-alcohol dehydrogenase-like predicted oxidoreductase
MIPRVSIAPDYSVPRLIVGGWQLSTGHSANRIDPERVFSGWDAFLDQGADTLDCADIYTGVEALIGRYLARRRRGGLPLPQIHTKLVPDLAALPSIDRGYVGRIVDRSLDRLGVERLDLVQFHWWDYRVPRYVEVLGWLDDLVRAGKIRLLGLTNFDSVRLVDLAGSGIKIATIQVQYSVLDRRPERRLAPIAADHGITLLSYGALAGGFLSDRWVGAEPPSEALNRSLVKYRLIVDDSGGWSSLQRRLVVLRSVAERHRTSVAAVALRWVLDRSGVGAVVVGATSQQHLDSLVETFAITLDDDDRRAIDRLSRPEDGIAGDVYEAERVPGGRHAAIMRYDLNAGSG